MWHSARQMERQQRVLCVDYRKRAERRRHFYEQFQQDPAQFLQCHGRGIKIHLDPSLAAAADKNMMPWPADPSVKIDRFDGRAHLDHELDLCRRRTNCKEEDDDHDEPGAKDEKEASKIFYERYRILVQNDFLKINEAKFLRTIDLEEQFGGQTYSNSAKKTAKEEKKLKEKNKAAIGFVYEDTSTIPPKIPQDVEDSKDSDASEASDVDLDVNVDLSVLPFEARVELNNLGTNYKMAPGDFCRYMNRDLEEQEDAREAKRIEEEKANLSGKKSRRERRILKERRKRRRRQLSPIRGVTSNERRERGSRSKSRRSSSSSSSSDENVEAGRVQYITSFGNDEEEDELEKQRRSNRRRWSTRKEPRKDSRRGSASRENIKVRRQRRSTSPKKGKKRSSPSSSSSGSSSDSSDNPTAYRSKYRNRRRSSSSSSCDANYKRNDADTKKFAEVKEESNPTLLTKKTGVLMPQIPVKTTATTIAACDESNTEIAPPRKSYYKQIRQRHKEELSSSSENNEEKEEEQRDCQQQVAIKETVKPSSNTDVKNKIKKRMKAQLSKLFKEEKQLEDERRRKEEEERVKREEEMRQIASKLRAKEREKRHQQYEMEDNLGNERRQRSTSPRRQRSRSPRHQRSRSPRHQRSRSPRRQRSRSPRRDRSHSRSHRRSPSPRRRRSRSRRRESDRAIESSSRSRDRRTRSRERERSERWRRGHDPSSKNNDHDPTTQATRLVDY